MRKILANDPFLSLKAFIRPAFPLVLVSLALLPPLSWQPAQGAPSQSETEPVFRFHIVSDPHSLDPARLTSSDASYFFGNVMRGLYRFTADGKLLPEGAESCRFETPRRFACRLSPDTTWSDGKAVEADEYVRAFRRLLAADSKNPSVEILRNLKNALAVHSGQKPTSELGIRAVGKNRLIFEFDTPDPEFALKLTSSILVPVREETFPKREDSGKVHVNGPFKVASWKPGRRIRLEPNPHYKRGHKGRPAVEIVVVDDDQTALHLYEQKELSFLRRLPTTYISQYKSRPDFRQIPMSRFDYVGFGEDLKDQKDLRAALSYSADFRELQKIYDALGIPGCPSIPEELMDHPRCIQFDLKKARKYLAKVPEELKKRRLRMMFSKLGGDDIKKGAEWFQAQWKKNLGLTVDLEQTEQGVFLQTLRSRPPAIYRKGVSLDRPTCLAALEKFSPAGTENFLKLETPQFQKILSKLSGLSRSSSSQDEPQNSNARQQACGEGIQYLLDQNLMIPLGRIHFTLLVETKFSGWSLNEMNQLDLSQLEVRK